MHLRPVFLASYLFLASFPAPATRGDAPPDSQPPRTDLYGDPLPDGAVFRIGTTRLRHGIMDISQSSNLLMSPDSKHVFSSGGGQRAVCMWEIATGREVRRFPVDVPDPIFSLSADGALVAVGDGRFTIHLFNTLSGEKQRTIDVHELRPAPFNCGLVLTQNAFSSDGRTLTAFQWDGEPATNRILRWETATGKTIGIWETYKDQPLALSSDGQLAALLDLDNRTIRLWETATGKKLLRWKAGSEIPRVSRCLVFSPNSRTIVTAGEDAMIRVYATATGKEVHSWKGCIPNNESGESIRVVLGCLAFTPDGKTLASVDRKYVLRLWDPTTGREVRHFQGVLGPVAFSQDGTILAAAGADSRVRLWDAASGRDLCPFADPGAVTDLAFSPDGRILAENSDRGVLRLLEARTGLPLKEIPGCTLLAFSSDGNRLLVLLRHSELMRNGHVERSGRLCLLDAATGKERVQFQDTTAHYVLSGWSPDGKVLVTLGNGLRVWDAATGEKLWEFRSHKQRFRASCSPDTQIVAIADENETIIRLFATTTGNEMRHLTSYSEEVEYHPVSANSRASSVLFPNFAPNGKVILAGCDRNSFGLWDVASGKRTLRWNCADVLPVHPTFSPDGKWLALLDTHCNPCLLDTARGQVRHRLASKGRDVDILLHANLAFSPDSRMLAAAYDPRTLVLWEVATGRPICTWPGHSRGSLNQIVFSPDCRRLATVGSDGTALVWDVTGLSPDGRVPARKLAPEQIKQAWSDLADADPAKAHRAIWSLVADPAGGLPLLRAFLHPVPGVDARRIAHLMADLDSDDFTAREMATRELRRMGELAEPTFRTALKHKSSLEIRQRVQGLLEEIDSAVPPVESLRGLRAIALLEYIANDDSLQLLHVVSRGATEARLTLEAKASLARLRFGRLHSR